MKTTSKYIAPKLNKNTVLFWRGFSELDPTVEIGAFLTLKSHNRKTGNLPQIMFLRLDMHPAVARMTSADGAVCGVGDRRCPHAGDEINGVLATCYVKVGKGPRAVWQSWKNGRVREVSIADAGAMIAGRKLRLGSYGEPASIPADVLRAIAAYASGVVGYTHQWAYVNLQDLCMASVETLAQKAAAESRGYRAFMVLPADSAQLAPKQIFCPATPEGGSKSHCVTCGLCNGSRGPKDARASIAVMVHGSTKKYFPLMLQRIA